MSLLGCIMLAVVLLVVLPNCFNISLWSLAVALRNPQCSAANDSSAACETMVRQSSRLTPALDTVSSVLFSALYYSCCCQTLRASATLSKLSTSATEHCTCH